MTSAYETLLAACTSKKIDIIEADLTRGLMRSSVSLRCQVCENEWRVTAGSITRKPPKGTGCPSCGRQAQAQTLSGRGKEKFEALCGELGYEILSEYAGTFGKVKMRCRSDGAEFSISPSNMYDGGNSQQRCPSCSGHSQNLSAHDAVGRAIDGTTWGAPDGPGPRLGRTRLRCSVCNAEKELGWEALLLAGRGPVESRKCDCRRYGEKYESLILATPGYSLLDTYLGSVVAVRHRHDTCGEVWMCRPHNFEAGTRCPKCARSGRSSRGQTELAAFVRSLGLDAEENVPGLIPSSPRSEVDLLVKSALGATVAIDFDGVWWHAEGPSRLSAALSQRTSALPGAALGKAVTLAKDGTQLVRVYSDEWRSRRPAVESRLRAILGKPSEILNARSLVVDPGVPASEARAFLAGAHSQGSTQLQDAAVGLRREGGELAAVMTFGERSLGRAPAKLELLRFCCLPGVSIRGGASRLLQAFLRNYSCGDSGQMVTYADLRWTPLWGSKMYESLGFVAAGRTDPAYDYVHPSRLDVRVSRLALQKYKLLQSHPGLDPSMTGEEMAESLGYSRVWNCGNLRYVMPLAAKS